MSALRRILGMAILAAALLATGVAADAGPEPRVEIYTSPGCGYCKALRGYLQTRGIAFEEHNINATLESRAAFFAMGGRGTPLTVVDGRWIHGFNPLRLEAALREARSGTPASPNP